MTKTILQATAVLFAGIFLLGCPIDESDFFEGDVDVVNNAGFTLDIVSIAETGAALGPNLGALVNGATANYSGYDCATSYTNHAEGGDAIGNQAFTPTCGGTTTITWVAEL